MSLMRGDIHVINPKWMQHIPNTVCIIMFMDLVYGLVTEQGSGGRGIGILSYFVPFKDLLFDKTRSYTAGWADKKGLCYIRLLV